MTGSFEGETSLRSDTHGQPSLALFGEAADAKVTGERFGGRKAA